VAPGQARISIGYVGQGTAIDFVIKATNSTKTYKHTLNPGQRTVITLPFGDYTIDATVNGLTLASETIGLPDQSVTLMFAVGNTGKQSLTLLNRTIRDVF
jgi:predicted ferric reductase